MALTSIPMTARKARSQTLRRIDDPSKSDPSASVSEAVVAYVRKGNRFEAAAARAGCSPVSAIQWVARGVAEIERLGQYDDEQPAESEEPYVQLVMGVLWAEAELEGEIVDRWTEWFEYDWRATAAFAAKRFRKHWGDEATKVELSGPGGGPVRVVSPSLAELEAIVAKMEAGLAEIGSG